MKIFAILLIALVCGCTERPASSREVGSWQVTGVLVSELGSPLSNESIELLQVERDASGSFSGKTILNVQTDPRGRFKFVSTGTGEFAVIAPSGELCHPLTHIGHMSPGDKKNIDLRAKSVEECRIVL